MTKYGASGETIARLFMYSLPEVSKLYLSNVDAAGFADGIW